MRKPRPPFVTRIHAVCTAIRDLPVPVVAQLHGAVIGAGLEIAAACDLRIAAEGTKFAMPEVRLGIPSVVEAALLPRLVEIGSEERVVQSLLAGDREALRVQKQLLQLWEEAPLSTAIAASIERFTAVVANSQASAASQRAPSPPPSSGRDPSRKG
jgi:enoyl-CoA hydratase